MAAHLDYVKPPYEASVLRVVTNQDLNIHVRMKKKDLIK